MGISFSLKTDPDTTEFRVLRVASQAYTFGDACAQDRTSDAIDVVPATASTTTFTIFSVAMETVTSAATSLLSCILSPRQRWAADAANTGNTNHNYQRMLLTNANSVNNTGTDNTTNAAVFEQTGVIDATNKRIIGRFLPVANVTA